MIPALITSCFACCNMLYMGLTLEATIGPECICVSSYGLGLYSLYFKKNITLSLLLGKNGLVNIENVVSPVKHV